MPETYDHEGAEGDAPEKIDRSCATRIFAVGVIGMRRFNATAVAAVELADVNTFVVVLAEAAEGSGQRLELQRAIVIDAQDQALGFDTYCVVTDDCSATYGGIRWWSLADGTLQILLDDAGVRALGTEGFVIGYPRDREEILRAGLTRVLEA